MTREELITKIRNLMVEKMEGLQTSVDKSIGKMKTRDDRPTDYFDLAALESSTAVELKCLSQKWQILLDTNETILRIDRGLHGFCDLCGCQISMKRLQAAPMSKLCLNCQEKNELGNRPNKRRPSLANKVNGPYAS
jgi:DnaK suppressor protein